MALGDQAGIGAVQKIDLETLPHVASIINDTLQQVSVLLTGAITALDGGRIATFDGLGTALKPTLDPLVAEWKRTNDVLERLAAILERVNLKP